jgi:hypothetical protein
MKAEPSSEVLVAANQTALCHNPETAIHIFTDMKIWKTQNCLPVQMFVIPRTGFSTYKGQSFPYGRETWALT